MTAKKELHDSIVRDTYRRIILEVSANGGGPEEALAIVSSIAAIIVLQSALPGRHERTADLLAEETKTRLRSLLEVAERDAS